MFEAWIHVSKKGKNCGVVVLSTVIHERVHTLQFNVLPKFWNTSTSTSSYLSIDLDKIGLDDSTLTIFDVFELEYLRLTSSSHETLEFVQTTLGQNFGSTDTKTGHQLFEIVPTPKNGAERVAFSLASRVEAMWRLFVQVDGASDELHWPITPDHSPIISSRIADSIKDIFPLIVNVFVAEAERLARDLRPAFRATKVESEFLRGQVKPSDLMARRATRSNRIICEFDELDFDSPWHTLVLTASRKISRDSRVEDSLRRRATSVSLRIPSSIVSERDALKAVNSMKIPRKLRPSRLCLDLAKLLLLEEKPWGLEADQSPAELGLIFAVSVQMDKIFERLLGTLSSDNCSLSRNNQRVQDGLGRKKIFLRADDLEGKEPDLLFRGVDESWMLVDAKYKSAPDSFESMNGSDQYQQFAYAASSGVPVLFCFVGDENQMRQTSIVINEKRGGGTKVAISQVPFPVAENLDEWRASCAHLLNNCETLLGSKQMIEAQHT